ncbi:WW domain-binding protein 11-like [Nycticebus coucang]|uniref:WW domain-binding protein 11-like n=1 Tax=Nycticebus coucang TaxID=9470 RepID=UPI00234DD03A|nr:WW domain-binding protein 11-like [Nycticebus coucang]
MPLPLPGLPRASDAPASPPALRPARLRWPLGTCPGAAARPLPAEDAPPAPPPLPSRPGTRHGRAPGAAAAAQVRRQLRGPPAGRRVQTAADAGLSSSRAPGAQNAQPAASGDHVLPPTQAAPAQPLCHTPEPECPPTLPAPVLPPGRLRAVQQGPPRALFHPCLSGQLTRSFSSRIPNCTPASAGSSQPSPF